MKFSVIIPAYNAETTIENCIHALLSQSVERSLYEIIVVDDGSKDRTADILRTFPVDYHFQENQGPAAARNKGAQLSKGEIILFTDSDCVPDRFWLERMTAPFSENPGISGVKGAYKSRQSSLTARFAQAEFEDRFTLLKKSDYIDMVDTYSAAFKREVFINAGGFDPSFPVANNEDTELSYRLVSQGHLMVFNPEAFVYHTHPDTLKKYLRIKFWRGYWRLVVYARFPEKAINDTYTPVVIKFQTLLAAMIFGLVSLSLFWPHPFFYLIWGVVILVLGSALPFSRMAFQKDKLVGLLSPFYCLLRAVVFAAGSLGGVGSVMKQKIFNDPWRNELKNG